MTCEEQQTSVCRVLDQYLQKDLQNKRIANNNPVDYINPTTSNWEIKSPLTVQFRKLANNILFFCTHLPRVEVEIIYIARGVEKLINKNDYDEIFFFNTNNDYKEKQISSKLSYNTDISSGCSQNFQSDEYHHNSSLVHIGKQNEVSS